MPTEIYMHHLNQPFNSCEIALMKFYNDVLEVPSPKIMTFLNFSVTFDTVVCKVLIERFKTEYGVRGIAIN